MKMTPYLRLAGDSGVLAYRIGPSAIDIEFVDGKIYRYTDASAGRERIERMKQLATEGRGLSTYISQHVQARYASVR